MKPPKPWLDVEVATIRQMAKEGALFPEIAKHLPDRSVSAVQNKANALGIQNGRISPGATELWTPESKALLRTEWGKGTKAATIGKMLDVSKSAVLGKVYRLGLPKRQTSRRSKPPSPLAAFECAPSQPSRTCQWPHGEPGKDGFHFCGAPSATSGARRHPYCSEHMSKAYKTWKREESRFMNAKEAKGVMT